MIIHNTPLTTDTKLAYIYWQQIGKSWVAKWYRPTMVRRSTGQHYSTISARYLDITTRHPSWQTTSSMAVPWQFRDSSTIVPGYYQVTSMAPGWILKSHVQKIGQNYGIVSAKINRRSR